MCKETAASNGLEAKTQRMTSSSSTADPQPSETKAQSDDESSLLKMLRLPICATGICVSYLCYGYFQERLFSDPKDRLGPSFVLVTSCVTNVLVALIWKHLQELLSNQQGKDDSASGTEQNDKPAFLNHKLLVATSFFYVAAMTSSNEAIPLVSYPVAVLAKSCKLIPIMIVGQFVERKLYPWIEWVAAFLISSGICIFHFSRMQGGSSQGQTDDATNDATTYGMGLLLLSLILDGMLSSCQNLLKQTKALPHEPYVFREPNAVETMLFVNLDALLFLVPWTMYNGQLVDGLERLWGASAKLFILNGAVGCGQIFIFLTITWYSSIMTTTITTTRKFFTILLSVHSFGHVFTGVQWFSVALVFCGLYLSIIQQQRSKSVKTHKAKQD